MPTTDRLLLPTIGDPEIVTPDILREAHDGAMAILKQAVLFDTGPIANRPTSTGASPGVAGRVYLSTDESTPTYYLDLGTAWIAMIRSDDTRLTNARTPTTHAATHQSGGSDPLYKTGSRSPGSTDGSGRLSDNGVAHGLGATPSIVIVQITGQDVMHYEHRITARGATTFSVDFATSAGGVAVSYDWIAIR